MTVNGHSRGGQLGHGHGPKCANCRPRCSGGGKTRLLKYTPSGAITANDLLRRRFPNPTDRTESLIESVPELLGCAKPVALGHQLGDLVPVGVVVEHHADDGGRPWRLIERRPGVGQGQQLVTG